MATRSLWRIGTKLTVITAAIFTGGAAATIATFEDPSVTLKLCTTVPVRLARDAVTTASIAFGNFALNK